MADIPMKNVISAALMAAPLTAILLMTVVTIGTLKLFLIMAASLVSMLLFYMSLDKLFDTIVNLNSDKSE